MHKMLDSGLIFVTDKHSDAILAQPFIAFQFSTLMCKNDPTIYGIRLSNSDNISGQAMGVRERSCLTDIDERNWADYHCLPDHRLCTSVRILFWILI
jgi:hypothetical protein